MVKLSWLLVASCLVLSSPAFPEGDKPPTTTPSSAPSTAPTSAPVELELTGKITAHKGKVVTIAIDKPPPAAGVASELKPPVVGVTGELFKHFDKKFGNASISGWLDIAAVTVKKVEKDKLTLTVTEEKSKTIVNGEKVDHFKVGNEVKLVWTKP